MERPAYFQIPKETSWPVWTQVLRRSAIDPEFRRQLLENPDEALEAELGKPRPEGYVVRFTEKPAGVSELIVLPPLIEEPAELTEEELEAVAGGTCSCSESCERNSCADATLDPGVS